MSNISYRPDIDGLRALAVVSVIIFHIEASYLPGGFLGVDVFFVISGFLITKIILRELMEKNFSFKSFYTRRAKRLLPPLFFVLTLTAIAGFVILLPYDFYKFGISLLSVVTFISNLQYALRSGDYFSGDASEWPLLHTWSLAVEEQYYFILPFLILFIFKITKNHLLLIFGLIGLCSFTVAEIFSRTEGLSSISYYLIITRMGELLVGSVLAAAQLQKKVKYWESNLLTGVCFILIITLLITASKHYPFPGFIAMLLCVPVAILMNSKNTFVNKFLSLSPMVFIGLISYSLYLVHWPVLAFGRYLLNVNEARFTFTLPTQALLLLIIIVLSLVSYYIIEKPLRKIKLSQAKVFTFYFVLPTLVMVSFGGWILISKGVPSRMNTENVAAKLQFSHINKTVCPSLINLGCVGGSIEPEKTLILYGNSHAEHYFEFVSLASQNRGYQLELYGSGGCGLSTYSVKCNAVRDAFESAKDSVDKIIIALRWDNTFRNESTLEELDKLVSGLVLDGKSVFILGQPPILTVNPSKLANCRRLNVDCAAQISISNAYPEYNKSIRRIVQKMGAVFIDPYDFVTDKMSVGNGKVFYYSDFDHLSVYGARWLYNESKTEVEELIFGPHETYQSP